MKNIKKKILAITLARGNSKGIKKKNIISLCNRPLIFYTISEALKSKFINDYIVSTDNLEIKKIATKYGASVPFIRPKQLAKDTSSSVLALQHAVNFMENKNKIQYDYIIELMATNPLKTHEDIDSCIKKLLTTRADSVIAVHNLEDHHPARIKKIVNDKIIDFCVPEKKESRRQDLKPKAYIRSGSIYALDRNYLMSRSERYGSDNSRPYILPPERAINIDTEADIYLADYYLRKKNQN